MITTPPLGKPFKSIKYVSKRLCGRDGAWDDGKLHIYLDPRGDAGFACGIPAFIPALLGTHPDCGYRDVAFHRVKEGVDEWFIKYSTASALEDAAMAIFRTYSETIKEKNKTEFIKVSFTGVVPAYDESGAAKWNEWVYKPNIRFGGSAGRSLEIKLGMRRGYMVGNKFCVMLDGELHQDDSWNFDSGYQTIYMPFTQEVWDQLIEVRETLTKAAVMLGDIFSRPAEDIPALLSAKFTPALPAPEQPPTKRIIRRRK